MIKASFLLLGLCAALHAVTKEVVVRPPNVIVMVTDDQRFDALGIVQREQGAAARFPFFRTPHLDRLARDGARFRNGFVVHSLCSPSRASMLTGQPTYLHGIRDNRTPFRSASTWPAALRKAGYATAYFGKWHMGTQEDRPGFTDAFTFVDQGVYPNCRFLQNGVWVDTQGWVDDVTTDHAIDYIRAHRAGPFALFIGFKSPHDNRTPPARYANLYAGVEIAAPPNFHARPPFPAPPAKPWNPRIEDRLNYFRCLQGVDDNVGKLLDALEREAIADDTLIVFAGDNGYYLGEHGLGDKRSAYEESIRIPLLMRYPRKVLPGTVIDELILNMDIPATILELCGVPLTWAQQGRSVLPLLGMESAKGWRTDFFYENYRDPEYPEVTFDSEAVRTASTKLVVYPGHPEWSQLFDLREDPTEAHNLFDKPAARDLAAQLQQRLQEVRRPKTAAENK